MHMSTFYYFIYNRYEYNFECIFHGVFIVINIGYHLFLYYSLKYFYLIWKILIALYVFSLQYDTTQFQPSFSLLTLEKI